MPTRTVRLFLSSTFRDFGEERDLLVKRVFPALRARLRGRFVELVEVDLRWGITAEEAERGEVLPICLSEIDRARPYFIGMLGERYGWVPPPDGYATYLLERQPWLKKHQGGKSVTELEILHGVLNNRRMKGCALFYFRSPAYARIKVVTICLLLRTVLAKTNSRVEFESAVCQSPLTPIRSRWPS